MFLSVPLFSQIKENDEFIVRFFNQWKERRTKMAEIILSQAEADAFITADKSRINDDVWHFPNPGKTITIPLASTQNNEEYLLDIRRGSIKLTQATYQNRVRKATVLLRLDLDGPPHTNPDGETFPCPHLHIYREGFADKWATDLPNGIFSNPSDVWQTLGDFMRYANISNPPSFQRGVL